MTENGCPIAEDNITATKRKNNMPDLAEGNQLQLEIEKENEASISSNESYTSEERIFPEERELREDIKASGDTGERSLPGERYKGRNFSGGDFKILDKIQGESSEYLGAKHNSSAAPAHTPAPNRTGCGIKFDRAALDSILPTIPRQYRNPSASVINRKEIQKTSVRSSPPEQRTHITQAKCRDIYLCQNLSPQYLFPPNIEVINHLHRQNPSADEIKYHPLFPLPQDRPPDNYLNAL